VGVVLAFTTLASLLVAYVGFIGLAGKLPPNNFAGIRTPYTRRSSENWYAVHQCGGPYMVLLAVPAVAAGLSVLPFAFAGKLPAGVVTVVVLSQVALVVAGVVLAWLLGTARAKARSNQRVRS